MLNISAFFLLSQFSYLNNSHVADPADHWQSTAVDDHSWYRFTIAEPIHIGLVNVDGNVSHVAVSQALDAPRADHRLTDRAPRGMDHDDHRPSGLPIGVALLIGYLATVTLLQD